MPDDNHQDPNNSADRLIIRISAVLLLLLAIFIWVDTPPSATEDRLFSWVFLRLAVTIAIGGGLFYWWRKKRKDSP